MSFPFKKPPREDWPIFTLVEAPALAKWKQELSTPWKAALKKLPMSALDPDSEDDQDESFIRDELRRGLTVLEKWVTAALKPTKVLPAVEKSGNALVLILDGDQ